MKMPYRHFSDNCRIRVNSVVQTIWELVNQGILVPNDAKTGTQSGPFVSFTAYGESLILDGGRGALLLSSIAALVDDAARLELGPLELARGL